MMKMMKNKLEKILSDEEDIDLKLSYSRISDFDRNGPQALIKRREINTDGTKHGSIVDILLVDKLEGTNEFDKY